MSVGAQLDGDLLAGGGGVGFFFAAVISFAAGIALFFAAAVMSGSVSSPARARWAAAISSPGVADRGVGGLAGRVIDDLGVRFDGGDVVADLVYPVVLGRVLEEVLLPPPGLQPGQDVRRARIEVGGEDLEYDPAVLEQGELPGFAVVLDLDFLLGPRDLPPPAAHLTVVMTGSMAGMASGARR